MAAAKKVAKAPKASAGQSGSRLASVSPDAPAAVKATETKKKGRPFPWRPLEEALKIPQAIREKNNGHPWNSEEVAQAALGLSRKNSKVWYATASSRDYGLTIGTRDTETIELTQLGRDITFAGDANEIRNGRLRAFFNVDIFKRVFDHYGGAKLPEKQFLRNTLQNQFGLDSELVDDFEEIFRANCKFLGIEDGLGAPPPGTVRNETKPESSGADIKLVGEPAGKFDRTAFVIMPFTEKAPANRPTGFFKEVLKSVITPAGNQAGFAVETAGIDGSDVIQSTIIERLLTADLVVADLADHNPNVLFELGIRIAEELPVAIIKARGTAPVFDVDNLIRVATYDPNLWASSTPGDVDNIRNHLKATYDNRGTGKSYRQLLTGRAGGQTKTGAPPEAEKVETK